jgi:hypothetical protein
MGRKSLLDLVNRELELYRNLLSGQEEKIDLYLQGDLDQVMSSMNQDKKLLQGIRINHQLLREQLDGRSLTELTSELESSEREAVKDKIEQLKTLTRELGRLNIQNYRYTQASFGYTRSMLKQIFTDNANYNQNGYLQAGQKVIEF